MMTAFHAFQYIDRWEAYVRENRMDARQRARLRAFLCEADRLGIECPGIWRRLDMSPLYDYAREPK